MRLLWTVLKVALACALILPIGIIVLATLLGIFGALLGLAILTLRIAVAAFVVWVVFRLAVRLFGGASPRSAPAEPALRPLPPSVDPHYEAAMRELNRELGDTR